MDRMRFAADKWPPQQVAELARLVGEGLTSGQVATAMGISRGAVIGKADRLGLDWKTAAPTGPAAIKRRTGPGGHVSGMRIVDAAAAREKAEKKAAARPVRADDPFVDQPGSVSLDELRPCHCRWPYDHGCRPTRYCGAERASPATPYCQGHLAIAVGQGTASERRADDVRVAA